MLEVALPKKKGVVIFRLFAADRDFGTHPNLFVRSNYPKIVELSSTKLNAYKSKPGPLLFGS